MNRSAEQPMSSSAGKSVTGQIVQEHAAQSGFLRVLAVDDEVPALDELAYLLRADPRVGRLHTAGDATEALRVLRDVDVDAVFLDIRMPGLDGMELARVLGRFAKPPAVVFVTAYDDRAAEAFDLGVADYVRKPVRADRIAESLRRVLATRLVPTHPAVAGRRDRQDDPTIPVELAGTTRMLPRSSVRWVEAQGDYARLHTADASHLVRVSLATLAERWADAGFVRVHRSFLVQLKLITELRMTNTGYVVVIDDHELPVSRRHTRELKDRLVRAAKSWS
jgi:DNA-binding LytR/AlgR family response regulator